jgi:hypothetical protein
MAEEQMTAEQDYEDFANDRAAAWPAEKAEIDAELAKRSADLNSAQRKHDRGVVTALTEEQMVQRGGPAEVRQHARGRDGYVCRCMEVSEQLDPTTETHSAHPIPHVHDGDGFHELTKWEAAVKAVEEKEAE